MRRNEAIVWVVGLLMIAVSGCANITPHENFKSNLECSVGRNMDEPFLTKNDTLVSTRQLSNGDIEYRYQHFYGKKHPCIHIYEVNPETRIIQKVGFEGNENTCYITP